MKKKQRLVALIILLLIASFIEGQTYHYYFGNIHAHTGFSDGNQDSLGTGISTPAGSYAFAKLSQHFDFLGISEHNHYSSPKNPGFEIQNWNIGLNQANSANQDGTFLCLFGMEWGVTSAYHGHVLVYGYPQLMGWENPPASPSINYDVYNAKTDYDGLFRKVKDQPGAFATLAHPQMDDYCIGGNAANSLLNISYNSAWDSAIVGTPLRSGFYNTSSCNYDSYPANDYFYYYRSLLSKGYHLGCTYDHDNHNTTFGRSNAGRLVIQAPSLTRANFYEAMQKMHFYASDDWNAEVDFSMNGNIMGSVLSGTFNPVFSVVHNDGHGELADSIKIWRGVSNSPDLPEIVSISRFNNTAQYTDGQTSGGLEYYYFADIKQSDGQWIVTSPIWYRNTSVAGIHGSSKNTDFTCFPNPVSQRLCISAAESDACTISITDISGRVLYTDSFSGKDYSMDLSGFEPGIYELKLTSSGFSRVKKVVVSN